MGTLLREQYDFAALVGLREAHSSAFWRHANAIDACLGGLTIDALNLVRNLLVHKAGVADPTYRSRMVGLPAPQLDANERLQLDGDLVLGLIAPVINRGEVLIRLVDDWLFEETKGT